MSESQPIPTEPGFQDLLNKLGFAIIGAALLLFIGYTAGSVHTRHDLDRERRLRETIETRLNQFQYVTQERGHGYVVEVNGERMFKWHK